ncbi:MAG: hypothetical protein KatS3mg033_0094 [Thermonema sp.]|uniref:GLPGLI family protein n=1 Tax=Thermonema sp. TaxID=2231181 RepID=UPI0021DE7468|nr:GLPGLI family protein [Thermonema sp.]GIV38294.1 MAG: hypothetical protein KatS3mg033_0094 [Thermonema sp.]
MRHYIFVAFLLLMTTSVPQISWAQVNVPEEGTAFLRVAYRAWGEVDSVKKRTMLIDTLHLLIGDQGGFYFDPAIFKEDSIIHNMDLQRQRGDIIVIDVTQPPDYTATPLNWERIWQRPNWLVVYTELKYGKMKYVEQGILDWQIFEETEEVNGLVLQKAKTTYGGREWTAWFAKDIPLPYGPWKLRGLPGLIVKAKSSGTSPYYFLMVGIEKVQMPMKLFYAPSLEKEYVEASHEEAIEYLHFYYTNPAQATLIGMQKGGLTLPGIERSIAKMKGFEHFNPMEFLAEKRQAKK